MIFWFFQRKHTEIILNEMNKKLYAFKEIS